MRASANVALAVCSLLVSAWLAKAVIAQESSAEPVESVDRMLDVREFERALEADRTLIDDRRPEDRAQPVQELPTVDLQMRLKEVRVRSTPQGDRVTLDTDRGPVELTPEE